jgi:hypothetical protein
MKKTIKFGLMVCSFVALTVLSSGCFSYDTTRYANGTHHSLAMLLPGSPSIDGSARLVQDQPQQPPQMYQVQNGALVPVVNGQVLSNGTFVVSQPQQAQNNKLPLAPVYGINSGSQFQGYNGYYDSSADCGNNYQPRVYYTQHFNTSNPGVNSTYDGCLRPAGRSGGVNYPY